MALMASVLLAAAALTVRAEDAPKAEKAPAPAAAPAASDCTQYRTICVKEWVPEKYTCEVTTYKTECKQEKYTAYRCEKVCEQKTRTVTCYKMVKECKPVTKTVCEYVPCCETKTVMKQCVKWVNVEKTVKKCVDRGHWECKEVACGPTIGERLASLGHHHGCCDPCNPCPTTCCAPCPRTKTVKCWVPCKVWEEHKVCCKERVVECVPTTCTVKTCKKVEKQVTCNVTVCRCVPECKTETYTCVTNKMVPYEACRTVKVCVPCKQTVEKCRMVCREVQKQVAVTCCPTTCCESKCHRFHFNVSGLFHRSCGCDSCGSTPSCCH